ncbi:small secreted protein [Ophiocordyceps camponoti-floridani]|uniref:NADH dehydrogenase [ubiquinone] 1 alpha subcomplex subunit 1 n=1 Tax=Ophiocordyceps camponoti-floridani TaxID=2030778 RepID=A0A8H4QDT1_9HYPO|nr:small secreted protein [Ophiocordyceps camponoti-floridani]
MPVPFEALLPYAIMIGMFGVTGLGLGFVKSYQNEGKNPRWSLDAWDRQMMVRDKRLTGTFRGQTDHVDPPPGFELSNAWRMEKRIC